MSNAISYSLFGYGHGNPADFNGYLRGFHINVRMAQVLYPGWTVCLAVDEQSWEGPYKSYFVTIGSSQMQDSVDVQVKPKQALCLNMLRRLEPVFATSNEGYDRVLCRDTDSLLCWKERQAVAHWEKHGRIINSMADSVSHTIPLMGGMIGVMSKEFKAATGYNTFEELQAAAIATGLNFERKGTDQDFLNQVILPKVHHSMTEHYFLGMPQSFRGDCHNSVGEVIKLPEYTRETNALAFHIGAAGFQADNTIKFLNEHGKHNDYWNSIEKKFTNVFYWWL